MHDGWYANSGGVSQIMLQLIVVQNKMKQTNTHAAGSISCYTERPQVSIDGMQTLPLKGMLASFMLLCSGKLQHGTCTKLLAEPMS